MGLMVLSLLYYLSYYRYGLNLSDEGYVVQGAIRSLRGQLPGADFHSYAPARTWTLGLLFKTFGVSITAERLMWVVWRTATCCCLWVLARHFLKPVPALLVVLVSLLMPGPWHKTPLVFSMTVVLLLLLGLLREARTWRLSLFGVGLGSLLLVREEVGLMGVVLGFTVLSLRWRKSSSGSLLAAFGAMLGGILVPFALASIPFLLHGRLPDALAFYGSELVRTAGGTDAVNLLVGVESNPGSTSGSGRALLEILLYNLPMFLVGISWAWMAFRWVGQATTETGLLLLSMVAAFGALTLRVQPDISHLLQVLPLHHLLALILLSRVFEWLTRSRGGGRILSLCSGALRFAYPAMVLTLVLVAGRYDPYYTGSVLLRTGQSVEVEVAGDLLLVERDRAEVTMGTVEAIRKHTATEEPIFVFPYAPMFYVLADRANPTLHDGVFAHLTARTELENEILDQMRGAGVRLVVMDREGSDVLNWPTGPLRSYLDDRFAEIARFGPYAVLTVEPSP